MQSAFYKANVAFTSKHDVKGLLTQLQDEEITYLTYECYLPNGRHYRLTSHPEWIEHYYREALYNVAVFEHQDIFNKNGVTFWCDLNRQPIYDRASEFDIDHGFTYFFQKEGSTHFFHLGRKVSAKPNQDKDKTLLSKYESFSLDFLDKTLGLRQEGEKQSIILHPYKSPLKASDLLSLIAESLLESQVVVGNKIIEISPKEARVAQYLSQGLCIKQISHRIGVSERTVKYHICSLKEKTRCKNLVQLGFKLASIKLKYKEG